MNLRSSEVNAPDLHPLVRRVSVRRSTLRRSIRDSFQLSPDVPEVDFWTVFLVMLDLARRLPPWFLV